MVTVTVCNNFTSVNATASKRNNINAILNTLVTVWYVGLVIRDRHTLM